MGFLLARQNPAASVLLFMGTIRDSETFSASAIVKVREYVQVSCTSNSDATGPTARNFICNWSLWRIRSCKLGTVESFVAVPEQLHALEPPLRKGTPPRIDTLHLIGLFCGAGGASCGFKDTGFTPRFGVEASYVAGEAFQKNCPTAISYNECFDAFLGRPWPKNSLQTTVISVCAPSSIFGVDKHPFIQVISTFKPAYALYNCSVNQLSPNNISGFRKLQYQILKLGYGFTYGILKATDFGVSTMRNRLVLIAAAPSQPLPELPSPTHGGTNQPSTPTLQNAISDLDWKNTTCKATGTGLKSAVAHPSDGFHSVSRHCTGCIITDFTKWDDSCTVADLNEPLPAFFTVPSEKWKCRHPNNPQRFLTVRELARALSFPDSWDFIRSLKDQYSQVANALPPLLTKAIAEEIKRVIVKCNSHLVNAL